ncbi:glycine zipper 2TM domain-containing protein [Hymenobacter sp. BT175]|uniref:glycine zipper 2TM domain-containing protein n=1 Tax=Hymenobacter translucens TaxID=2886507 RepID=UPI001D0F2C0A|nr:glycine zipper 2TM domain-containing protein [Hymenobacter translucens]MCC2547367.1 glycine zipper 2TM domain-containing protein [Hymenobacter translucens]
MKKLSYILAMVMLFTVVFGYSSQAQERKPWSPQAKGTIIGAGVGGAAGAIIHKRNRVVGGVVGGVAGGAAGYAIGKGIDNRKKAREAEAARVAAANRAAEERREAAYRAQANRSAVAARKSSEARTVTASKPATVPANANGFTSARLAAFADAKGNQVPYASNAAYLPNDSYGDPNAAYSTSEYRRKSW